MRSAETISIPTRAAGAWQHALRWAALTALAVPFAVLLHELGHFASHLLLGLKGTALHYSSTTYELERAFWVAYRDGGAQAAGAVIPVWKVAASTAAGLIVTYAVVAACCLFVSRRGPHPFVVGLGLVSPLRFVANVPALVAWFSARALRTGTDEANVSVMTGLPVQLLIVLGLVALAVGWLWLITRLPRERRAATAAGLVAGVAAGMLLYFKFAGPLLLP